MPETKDKQKTRVKTRLVKYASRDKYDKDEPDEVIEQEYTTEDEVVNNQTNRSR